MIQNFISAILFLEILSQAYNFIPHVPMDIIRVFIIPEFVAENLKANKNQQKKITHFIIQFCSRKLTYFTNLNSFETENNMPPKHSQKTSPVYKFRSKNFSVWCHLHCTISWHSRTPFLKPFKSKCLYISVYLSKKFLFQRLMKILSGGMGGWGRLNNFFKEACCLGLVKCFTIFHFNWNFLKCNYFSVFWYFHQQYQNIEIF